MPATTQKLVLNSFIFGFVISYSRAKEVFLEFFVLFLYLSVIIRNWLDLYLIGTRDSRNNINVHLKSWF